MKDQYNSKTTIIGSLFIPDGVTSIGDTAFYECVGLTSVTLPDSVTEIGDGAFHGCAGLTSVTLGKGLTKIGNFAFEKCSLTSIKIPDSLDFESIGQGAFHHNKLKTVTISNKHINKTNSEKAYAFPRGCVFIS